VAFDQTRRIAENPLSRMIHREDAKDAKLREEENKI